MDVGVLLLPVDPWPEARERARRLESLGYAHLWAYDHLSWKRYRHRPWHAAIPWLTGLAAATRDIRLGTMVASPNFRHPVTLAKESMTLDHVSDGRFVLGLGAGGAGFDATVLGGPPLPAGERASRLGEFVEVVDCLLRQPATSHAGPWYTVDEAMMLPGCLQHPRLPLAVAAASPRTLAIAARHADVWITYGDGAYRDTTPAGTEAIVRAQMERLDEQAVAHGRDPAGIRRLYLIGNTDERPLASPEAFLDFVGRYEELGFTDVVFHHPRADDPVWTEPEGVVEDIAADALPKLS